MLSKNEWDPLKSVIVGIANDAKIPATNIGLRCVNYADQTFSEYLRVKHGRYPDQVIQEANEDLERLCEFLRRESIHVGRPISNNPEYYNYCPRDTVLVHDDIILATPMAISIEAPVSKVLVTPSIVTTAGPCTINQCSARFWWV
jgi:glycine amidinotransferase